MRQMPHVAWSDSVCVCMCVSCVGHTGELCNNGVNRSRCRLGAHSRIAWRSRFTAVKGDKKAMRPFFKLLRILVIIIITDKNTLFVAPMQLNQRYHLLTVRDRIWNSVLQVLLVSWLCYQIGTLYTLSQFKQGVALTERNRTGPPCTVSRPTANAPSGWPARPPAALPTPTMTNDDDDRQQTPDSKTILAH